MSGHLNGHIHAHAEPLEAARKAPRYLNSLHQVNSHILHGIPCSLYGKFLTCSPWNSVGIKPEPLFCRMPNLLT